MGGLPLFSSRLNQLRGEPADLCVTFPSARNPRPAKPLSPSFFQFDEQLRFGKRGLGFLCVVTQRKVLGHDDWMRSFGARAFEFQDIVFFLKTKTEYLNSSKIAEAKIVHTQ